MTQPIDNETQPIPIIPLAIRGHMIDVFIRVSGMALSTLSLDEREIGLREEHRKKVIKDANDIVVNPDSELGLREHYCSLYLVYDAFRLNYTEGMLFDIALDISKVLIDNKLEEGEFELRQADLIDSYKVSDYPTIWRTFLIRVVAKGKKFMEERENNSEKFRRYFGDNGLFNQLIGRVIDISESPELWS